jgi:type IV pilus assembly protein PilY1
MTFISKSILTKLGILAVSLVCVLSANAQTTLAQSPMLTLKTAPGLVMLTMGRDLPLSKAAYNDVNDLDGDGNPDLFFKPNFKYEGYFAYDRCYTYGSNVFTPDSIGTAVVVDVTDLSKNYYKCPGKWSGNFLNWVTMSRIDVVRKVLYGGKRSTDSTTATILERSYIPQDATVWGKDYQSVANDGYNIADYTTLALPTTGKRHQFANVTVLNGNGLYTLSSALNAPQMYVYPNQSIRLWDLIATERRVLGTTPSGTPYTVRVATCVPLGSPAKYEDWCTTYVNGATTTYKPTGLLHKYGEAKTLAFGLLSGSYDKNYSGGVLRQNIDDFNREIITTTGQFKPSTGATAVKGIIFHLNELRPWGFGNGSSEWDCGFFFAVQRAEGACAMWGNPLGEMMYESLRYFSGASAGTPDFTTGVGTATHVIDNGATVTSPEPAAGGMLGLQRPAWMNPYTVNAGRTSSAAYPKCARPIQMVIGDPKTSFDSDQLPGIPVSFGTFSGSLGSLNVSDEADKIWTSEFGTGVTKNFFIGESGTVKDGNPSSKAATSFKNIRGHGPDATTNQGSFYGASVARYGKFTGLANTALTDSLRVDQISIALDSAVPQIKIPLNGKTVSIVPLSKSVGSCSPMTATQHKKGGWQPTGEITGFFIEKVANTETANATTGSAGNMDPSLNSGRPYYAYRISYADNDQGSDNETDAVVRYIIQKTASNQLSIGLEITYEATCMTMHQGYVISGTTNDGVYLDVGGVSGANTAIGYFLDTTQTATVSRSPGYAESQGTGPNYTNIPASLKRSTIANPRLFSTGTTPNGEFVPHDMLWYAAKYGSVAQDKTGTFTGFKLKPNGDPENYYFANNPSTLAAQIGQAFQKAASLSIATASAAASSGVKVSGGNLVYQASFDSNNWGGEIRAYAVKADGNIENNASWVASAQQPAPTSRNVVLSLATSTSPILKSSPLNAGSFALVTGGVALFKDDATFRYLLGDRTNEQGATGGTNKFRKRTSAIGDIVNSDPLYIGKSDFGYTDAGYDTFKAASDPKLIGVGSNDGFYRLLSATTGVEQLAFIPKTTSAEMVKLADPAYTHQYFVDGPSAWGHVNFGTTSPNWNAVIAGSLGAGGKAVFALNASAANLSTTNNGVLWEFIGTNNGTAGDYLGNVLNKPIVAQLSGASGKPAVLVGNGINSTNNKASLLVLNAQTGAQIANCTPTDAANVLGNGMTTITSVSVAKNGKVDFVYAGDYKGNLWRIDPNLGSGNCDSVKVFTAKDGNGKVQPITGDLTVTAAPGTKTGYMILFGTGKFSSAEDPANTDVQTMYGVWDAYTTSPIATKDALRGDLTAYTFGTYNATSQTRTLQAKADVNGGNAWYDTTGKKGWLVDLTCSGCPVGERFLDKPLVAGAATSPIVYFLTYIPGADVCNVGGDGWVTGIDPATGAYAKAYTSIADNSVFAKGAAPRGLFIVTTEKTSTKDAAEYIYVSRNGENTSDDPPAAGTTKPGLNDVGGEEQCVGADCISAGGKEITPPTPPSPTLGRRLVWRQIQ